MPLDQTPSDHLPQRCTWAASNQAFFEYHDQEWGTPCHEDQHLFEMLNLEGAQAGLSWLTILKRRDTYSQAFDSFDAQKISQYDDAKKAELLKDPGIIRNRLKIAAVIENAKAFLQVQREVGSFDTFIWQFVNGQAIQDSTAQHALEISQQMSTELKKRGFRFVGPTICYAFMQATGMVNDHEQSCFRRHEVAVE